MLPSHGRYRYSAVVRRPDYDWPDGRRLAVYVGLNLEHFAFGEGLGAELAPGGPQPDVLNYAWRDYGNRVGAWRLLDLLRRARPALLGPRQQRACTTTPRSSSRRSAARGDEIVGHGRTNGERQGALAESEERALIAEATATHRRGTRAARPRAGSARGSRESHVTPDLLAEAGYRYLLDWCHDDQPVWLATRAGPHPGGALSAGAERHPGDRRAARSARREFADMIVDTLRRDARAVARAPLVMGIALHAYIVGQPFRLRHLRRALRHVVRGGRGPGVAGDVGGRRPARARAAGGRRALTSQGVPRSRATAARDRPRARYVVRAPCLITGSHSRVQPARPPPAPP